MKNNPKGHTIVFYNVENLFDIYDDKFVSDTEFTPHGDKKWTEERYHRKIDALGNVIANIKSHPIIVGLTEVENEAVVQDLIMSEKLRHHNYSIIHQDSPDNRGIDLCLFYDKKYVTEISHEFLRISFDWNRDIKTRDVLFFRCEIAHENFWIIVNHWPSRRDGAKETEDKRVHVARAVRQKIEEIMDVYPEDKMLIMGDFNDEPVDRSVTQILKAKTSKNIKSDEFYNLMTEPDKQEKGTSTHMGEWLMIDQIMINRNFLHNSNEGISIKNNQGIIYSAPDVLYCRANGQCKPNQTYAGDHYVGGVSDHLPVYAILD
jgi:predicted extracellular nuclease